MSHPLRAYTATAMRITLSERQVFNAAVSAGHYPCNPTEMAGKHRVFYEDDLLTLFVFSRLLAHGLPPSKAGPLACEIGMVSRVPEGEAKVLPTRIYLITTLFGSNHVLAGSFDPDHEAKGMHYPGLGPIFDYRVFEVDKIRQHISSELKAEHARQSATVGQPDDE